MKKIAITGRLDLNSSYYEVRECLDINWASLMRSIDLLPILLPVGTDVSCFFEELDIDGVLLTGGNDLYTLDKNELSKKRDAHEVEIISYAIQNDIPIFGVCRGMQVLASYFGCTFRGVVGHVGIEHSLLVNEDSKYCQQLNSLDQVNSYHNYAVDTVAEGVLVSATDEKGVIKAIEHTESPIFGQMWHPERTVPNSSCELQLMSDFFLI